MGITVGIAMELRELRWWKYGDGYENPQTIRELYVVNRSEMSDNLSRGVNLRDAGIGLLGEIPISEAFHLENALTFTNGSGLNVAAPSEFSTTKNLFGRLGGQYDCGDGGAWLPLWLYRSGCQGSVRRGLHP